ncbi:hypothetical protein VC83_04194 [Pseudogymnoascus destructans]|uniref:Delta 8-(E)-sphingolipid desaturase n=2 Tax=Pseudogymnoascus destructans TaxID=655981 RepID=L8FMZ0_PSED2|nr:uncharacterized protein VC83_04194 [Pseudogymnoascus destructans]ELR01909.1 hypothetical protein GMDG_05087 [Pseudogymnoascus destructans 20631-21]OAF59037.1 hypothetical protein VC83_04194 [Pseudogymnoascus destructans]
MSRSRVLSRRQIEGLIANNQSIVIFDNKVLRLDKWLERHPGGKLPIQHMVGRDATDEIKIYHSSETLPRMDSFRIGYIDMPWVNFEPPISGGIFRPYEGEANMRKCAKTITTTLCPSKTSALPGADGTCNKKGAPPPCPNEESPLSNIQDKLDVNQLVTGTLDKFPRSCTRVEFMDLAEQLEIDSDIGRFPSVDPATQRTIINRYRQLHQKVQDDGHYECRFWEYGKECIRYVSIFALSMTALKYGWYMTSAMLLGLFWHQIMFTAHDAGHLAITHNYIADTLIGIFIADFCCGLSIGWWKSSHNVHHLVPNHPAHDPDIQNLPLFANSPMFFQSLRSTYYNFDFAWDRACEIAIKFQKYTYYPVMGIARFNLYLLSWLHLISPRSSNKGTAAWTRPTEILFMACYWYLFGYRLLWLTLPTWTIRVAFVLVSHIITMPLHVQITLSHWGMSTADLGATESFAQKQLRTTMDVDCPEWLDFIHGGLQFQAVHHLFPRVPRHNLRRVQTLVREFCKDVGIEYTIFGFVDGNKVVLSRLGDIAKQVEIMVACQKHKVETGDMSI